jgi:hypothetical protein
MTRNLKTPVLALLAFAAIAVAPSGAVAGEPTVYRTNNPNETILYSGQHSDAVFAIDYGEVKCSTYSYTGKTVGEELATFELTPSYTNCKTPGGLNTTIKMNGCIYVFNAGEFDELSNTEGWINIVCPAGQQITAEVFSAGAVKLCTVTIPPQNELKKVTHTNKADIEMVFTLLFEVGIEGFTYSQDPGTGILKCPQKNNVKNGGFFTDFTLRGTNPETKTPVNIWIE